MVRLVTLLSLWFVAGVATAAPQENYSEFKERFDKSVSIGANDDLHRLVQAQELWTILLVMETAEANVHSQNEKLLLRMEALGKSWAATKTGDFVKHMERYFAQLDPPRARERLKIKGAYDRATQTFAEAEKAKEKGKLNALAEQFQGYAEGLETLGDKYYAGNAWLYRALCMDEAHQGAESADLRAVAYAYQRLIDLRVEIDLKDRTYREAVPFLKRLEGLGFTGKSEGGEAGGTGSGPVATSAGASMTVAATFEALPELEPLPRPSYFLDEHYPLWDSLRFGAVDSAATLTRIADSPKFIRTGSTKIEVDDDGDGKMDRELPARGRLELFELELGKSKRKWAFFVQAGNQTDQYQGIELSTAASDDNWSIFVAPGASVVADVGGVRLQVFDDNMDGAYGSAPKPIEHGGMTKGLSHPEVDTLLLGDAKRAIPWSEYVKFPTGWMKLESQDEGARFVATPVTLKTGKLRLEAKGLTPEFLVVRGASDFENCYIDIAGGKEVEVPVGRYRVHWGLVTKGAKKQLIKALVLPTETSKTFEVTEGTTVAVPFGAPFDFVFEHKVEAESITITGNSVAIIGAGGERYERIYLAVPRPEVSYRKKGAKRGGKPVEMEIIQDRDGFDRKGGYDAIWKPLDLVLPKKANETEVEVQLTETKNKLFGNIEGSWR
jgi:hypothetical protein